MYNGSCGSGTKVMYKEEWCSEVDELGHLWCTRKGGSAEEGELGIYCIQGSQEIYTEEGWEGMADVRCAGEKCVHRNGS